MMLRALSSAVAGTIVPRREAFRLAPGRREGCHLVHTRRHGRGFGGVVAPEANLQGSWLEGSLVCQKAHTHGSIPAGSAPRSEEASGSSGFPGHGVCSPHAGDSRGGETDAGGK